MAVRVSVICCAYNQEKYIEDALKGFVSQKTDFDYEVLISDDASTDHTAEIIGKYEKQYPGLIRPLYLKENLYSKGKYPGELLMQMAGGDYFALCEGDDYWISEDKLQKQFEALEAHPECDMSAHAALMVRADDLKVIGKVEPAREDVILTMDQVINGGGTYLATNSLFFRRSIVENPPEYLKRTGIDYAYQMCGAARGGIVYLHDTMSAYRRGADGSFTLRMRDIAKEKSLRHFEAMIKMLDLVNKETDFRHEAAVRHAQLRYEFDREALNRNVKAVYGKKFASLRKEMGRKEKFMLFLKCFAPWSIGAYQRVKNLRRSEG